MHLDPPPSRLCIGEAVSTNRIEINNDDLANGQAQVLGSDLASQENLLIKEFLLRKVPKSQVRALVSNPVADHVYPGTTKHGNRPAKASSIAERLSPLREES